MRNASVCAVAPLLLPGMIACHGIDSSLDQADSLNVLSAGDAIQLEPGGETELAVQAQNADGEGVNNARVFFLISEPAALQFVGRSETDLVQDRTTAQDAAGIRASGIAKVAVVAAEVSEETTVRVLVGLASPSESTPESGVAIITVAIEPSEIPPSDGDAGASTP